MTKFIRLYKDLILPVGLLTSFIIGAGMFALPFIFYKAGILIGVFYLVGFTLILISLHLMYWEIIKNTKGDHRFMGYAKIYLGEFGFWLSFLVTIFAFLFILVIYIVLAPSFVRLVFPGVSQALSIFIFWFLGSAAIFVGIRKIAGLVFFISLAMIIAVFLIFIYGVSLPGFSLKSIPLYNPAFVLLPFGPVLFSLGGRAAISSVRDYFIKNRLKDTKVPLVIILGTIIPALVYLFFVLGVFGLSNGMVSPDAVSGIKSLPLWMGVLGILGFLSLWTSYVFLGLELKGIFDLDLKIGHWPSIFLVVVLPIAFYFLGFKDFIFLVGIAGGIFLAIEGMLVVWMWKKRHRGFSFVPFVVPLLFVGMLYEVFKMF